MFAVIEQMSYPNKRTLNSNNLNDPKKVRNNFMFCCLCKKTKQNEIGFDYGPVCLTCTSDPDISRIHLKFKSANDNKSLKV